MEANESPLSDHVANQQKLQRYLGFLKSDSTNTPLLLDVLRMAIDAGEFALAHELVGRHKDHSGEEPRFNAMAGQIELALGHFEESHAFISKALEAGLTEPATLLDFAQCCNYLGHPEEARAVLERHSSLKDVFPAVYYPLYARVLYVMEQPAMAIQQLDTFHEQHTLTADSAGLLSLMLFEMDERLDEAMNLATEALAKHPNAPDALIARTSLLLDAGQYDRAQRDSDHAVSVHPNNGRAWSSKAQVEFALLNFASARDAAQQAVRYMKNHIGTWHLLGWSHLMLKEFTEALEAFEASYALDRRFAETHGGLAAAYAHLGEVKRANHHITLAEKLDAEGFAATYAKMVLLNNNNQTDDAAQVFNTFSSSVNSRLGKTPGSLIEKRLFELSQQAAQAKNIH